ncbi:hypothetical protein JKF63_04377 [Porcisia hertigi]|uniref:Protein kinase domain-containing protein n=1 Tax=Porcisia hertigi TaxID=2761500 RepID=A0A836I5C3_9TRYP|nr:hypothetical protein JKF63_04377 [Porcisia hertigi]
MSDKQTRPRRPLSAAHPSAHASAASRSQTTTPMYRPLRYLGRGSFGVVLLAEEVQTGNKVAIKRVHYDTRLHNREVSILNTVLVDDPRPQQPSSTVAEIDSTSRHPGAGAEARFRSAQPPLSMERTSGSVHLWAGRHHPNIVELLNFYVTYDSAVSEHPLGSDIFSAEGTSTKVKFLPSRHSTGCCYPLGGGHGATSAHAPSASVPLSAAPYLEMVMSYLPMDLNSMKKYFFRFHSMPTIMTPSSPSTPLSSLSTDSPGQPECTVGGPPASPQCSGTGWSGSGTGKSGGDACNHLPLRWVKIMLFQLARGLAFMHARHVCHRDLKPSNVLVDPDTGRVQLCDFGSAKQIIMPAEEKNVSYICSRYYRAPELLFGALHYGCAVDMWSFGCIAAELLRESGLPLFRGCTSIDQMAELFKVLGAPSKLEMYAMNPQCAEALLRTHAMHRRQGSHNHYFGLQGGGCDGVEHSEYDVDNGGEFLHDALDDGDDDDDDILPRASPSPGAASTWSAPTSTKDPRHYEAAISVTPPTVATTTYDAAPTPFEDHYDVLKVRAIPWHLLFPVDTPTEAVSLVASLLCYAPKKRLTAVEVVEHSFFDDLFSPVDAHSAAPSEGEVTTSRGEDDKVAPATLRLPNGRLMPLAMFQVTEVERGLYTDAFLARMARQAELLADAMRLEQRS